MFVLSTDTCVEVFRFNAASKEVQLLERCAFSGIDCISWPSSEQLSDELLLCNKKTGHVQLCNVSPSGKIVVQATTILNTGVGGQSGDYITQVRLNSQHTGVIFTFDAMQDSKNGTNGLGLLTVGDLGSARGFTAVAVYNMTHPAVDVCVDATGSLSDDWTMTMVCTTTKPVQSLEIAWPRVSFDNLTGIQTLPNRLQSTVVSENLTEKKKSHSPAQQTPAQQTSAQQTPAQQTSAQQTPAQQTPAQQTPARQTPLKQTPPKQTPAQQTLAQQTPAHPTPARQTPLKKQTPPTPKQTPAQHTPPKQSSTHSRQQTDKKRAEPVTATSGVRAPKQISSPSIDSSVRRLEANFSDMLEKSVARIENTQLQMFKAMSTQLAENTQIIANMQRALEQGTAVNNKLRADVARLTQELTRSNIPAVDPAKAKEERDAKWWSSLPLVDKVQHCLAAKRVRHAFSLVLSSGDGTLLTQTCARTKKEQVLELKGESGLSTALFLSLVQQLASDVPSAPAIRLAWLMKIPAKLGHALKGPEATIARNVLKEALHAVDAYLGSMSDPESANFASASVVKHLLSNLAK
jgi:hypothetical protein